MNSSLWRRLSSARVRSVTSWAVPARRRGRPSPSRSTRPYPSSTHSRPLSLVILGRMW
jgi:hypothetical protein